MKKILVSLLLLVALLLNAFAMTGCLPGSKDDNQEEEGKINIRFYHTMGQNLRDVLDDYIEEFEALYPHINVIHEQVGNYDDVRDTISTELTTGAQPNLAYCYPDHVALYNVAKAVVTLDQYIDSTEEITLADGTKTIVGLTQAQKDDFIKGYYDEGKSFGDGKMYTLPLSKSTEVLYYNKTFFEANSEHIKVPETWDELEEVCAWIKANYPDSTPLGYDSEANWFITMTEQLGTPYTSATGDHFLFNDPANHAFVKELREWFVKGYVTTQDILGGYTSDIFKKQTSYMSIGSSAGATHQRPDKVDGEYPFEVGITSIPQVDAEKNGKVISQGPSLCILASGNADEDLASWLFMKFLTTNIGFQAEFSQVSGYVPVIKSVANDEDYKKFLAGANGGSGIAALSAKVCLEQESFYYTSPAFNGSSTARDEVGSLLQTCFAIPADKTSAEVDAAIAAAFAEAIAECKYQVGQG